MVQNSLGIHRVRGNKYLVCGEKVRVHWEGRDEDPWFGKKGKKEQGGEMMYTKDG